MPRRKKSHLAAAARARAGRVRARLAARIESEAPETSSEPLDQVATPSESLYGLVMVDPPVMGGCAEDARIEEREESSVQELEGDVPLKSAKAAAKSAYTELMTPKSKQQWAEGGQMLGGVHTGGAVRTLHDHRLKAHTKAIADAVVRESEEAKHFRAFFKRDQPCAAPAEVPLTASPDERARLAAAATRQASDADFARSQLPQTIADAARKAWTFNPHGASTASPPERENLPAEAREAVARAIAAARHESDDAFLRRASGRQVGDELVRAPDPRLVFQEDEKQAIYDV
ncbi:hypothetical protein BD310DRAFT_1041076 [Dichomitus squalens]|uniref:Uncharacterized protein n=1 Tax=Dichomitus squalens TaxID=114155 RepID=A0A4Q9PN42_9APHY|nr:hypothetical protein BD310DRAFT_1041076 [Dichomitus squalens]